MLIGAAVGQTDGSSEVVEVGIVGRAVGPTDGASMGLAEGSAVGAALGASDGLRTGACVWKACAVYGCSSE